MTPTPTFVARRAYPAAAALLLALVALLRGGSAWAVDVDDPGLEQTIPQTQAIVHGEHVLDSGHVDVGPRFDDDGTWRLMIHDDARRADPGARSVWRFPDETVFHVVDEARLTVPDDPAYAFLGAQPGSGVWVVPQTQNQDVVWMGWNTQDPDVMKRIDRGVTLTLDGVQGPGRATVYLQSGTFDEPQTLWTSTRAEPQPFWVDVNTHTHANWVFTEPGVYLMQVTASADMLDGTTASGTTMLRFAVGTDTSPDTALAAAWQGEAPRAGASATAVAELAAAAGDEAGGPGTAYVVAGVLLVAVVLAAVVALVVVRGSRAKRSVLDARLGSGAGRGTGPA
ncbi:choice-of-anchor M domain-containing protein [Motilibacter aurantiacus]|uniref:choice-of-anchor M domain-containing protein n=1 Tax=Motilibacter aurantiacus TaxID=2714955 RepID=UPI00140776E5|nr:tRNA-dihydrouridine synthase [Motilibacter aurantiacus]